MKLLNIGFIGGGMMTQIGHLPFYQDDPRCRVVAVCETRPSLIRALRNDFGIQAIIERHEDLLAVPEIDVVVISAPREATGPLTLAALEAGKHVITEKPMAHTYQQASQLVEMAKRMELSYSVGFMKRYDTGIQLAKKTISNLVQTNALGSLLTARIYDFSAELSDSRPGR